MSPTAEKLIILRSADVKLRLTIDLIRDTAVTLGLSDDMKILIDAMHEISKIHDRITVDMINTAEELSKQSKTPPL